MKHFGAALASYGSLALFHMVGITPEAQRLDDVVPSGELRTHDVGEADDPRVPGGLCARRSTGSTSWCSRRRNSSLIEMQAGGRTARRPAGARRIPLLVGDIARRSSRTPTAWGSPRGSRRRAGRCWPACASTRATPARWRRRTAGSGSPPTRPSSPTSSAATATRRRSVSTEQCVESAIAGRMR